MSLPLGDLLDALPETSPRQPTHPPTADAADDASELHPREAAEEFLKACGVRALSSDEETDVPSDDEESLTNITENRKQAITRKLEATAKSLVEFEYIVTANGNYIEGGWPRLLLDLRKTKLTKRQFEDTEDLIETLTYNEKYFRTVEKLMPVRPNSNPIATHPHHADSTRLPLLQVLRKHLDAVDGYNKAIKKSEHYEKQINYINDEIDRRRREKRESEEKKRQERINDIKEKAKAKMFQATQRATTQARSREARAAAVFASRQTTPATSSASLTDDDILDYDDSSNDPAWVPGSD